MSVNPEASITLAIALDGFRADLKAAALAGGKDFKELAINIERELKRGTAAATALRAASTSTSKGLQGIGTSASSSSSALGQLSFQLNDAATMAAMGASPFQILASQGGQIYQVMQQAGGATSLFKMALGAITPVMAAGGAAALTAGAAYLYYKHQLAEAEEKQKAAAEAATAAQQTYGNLKRVVSEITEQYRVYTGEITKNGLALEEQLANVDQAYAPVIAQQEARVDQLIAERDAAHATMTSQNAQGAVIQKASDDYARLSKEAEVASGNLVRMQLNQQGAADKARMMSDALDAEGIAATNAALAAKGKSEADRLAALAARLHAEQVERERAALEGYRGALEAMASTADTAAEENLSQSQQVLAAREAMIAQLSVDYQTAVEAALGNDAALVEADAAYADARARVLAASKETYKATLAEEARAAEESYRKQVEKFVEGEHKKQEAAMQTAQAVGQATGNLLGSVSQLLSQHAEEQSEKSKATAMQLFGLSKAAAIAQATVSTALAVTQGLAAAPPPASFVLAGAQAAAGAVQIAMIASQQPSFNDTPQTMRMSTGGSVHLAGGDYFAAAKNPRDLARQVGGGQDAPMVVVTQFQHKVLDAGLQQNSRSGGTLAQAISKAAGRAGHRRRK